MPRVERIYQVCPRLRRALRSGVEFGERPPNVAAELRRLHADLARELDELGDRWD